ncbi:hypothetical protein JRI60_47750 [Archangium violaceum]|uniref:hypothetical protein n=1 Tax=Archangium violaceum TaxID=83451 RepID=UPI00194EFEB1|nr:hypothetical protein [Archangium violaceum]QRN96613.1 hypothetical protein JRI60_47750 [Archangium violaceum]
MKRLPFLFLLLCLSLPAVAAERLAVRLQHGGTLGAAEAERVRGIAEGLARELTGLLVSSGREVTLEGRCGAEDACLRAVAAEERTEHVLVLGVVPRRQGSLDVDVAWVDTVRGEVARRPVTGLAPAMLARDLRPAVAALVPAFARKGWGGVVAPGTARLRVDGRMMTGPGEVVALTAGPHEVDVLLPSGEATLTREQVQEGVLLRLEPRPDFLPGATESRAPRGKGLRAASYVTFSVGALAVAGSLVAGGLSRGSLRGVESCEGRERDCTSFTRAGPAYEQAGRYARTGNVLLGAGAGLAAVGAGLFVFDLLSTPSE